MSNPEAALIDTAFMEAVYVDIERRHDRRVDRVRAVICAFLDAMPDIYEPPVRINPASFKQIANAVEKVARDG